MSSYYNYNLPTKFNKKIILGQVVGSSLTLECAKIIDRYPGPILLITTNTQSRIQIYDEMIQFNKNEVFNFPDWEILPYDNLSPSKDVLSDRIVMLYNLPKIVHGMIILSINTLMQMVCPPFFLKKDSLIIDENNYITINQLSTKLQELGYMIVNQVMKYGELAVRSSVLDFYPIGSKNSFRVRFFKDRINSFHIFDVKTQRTIKEVNFINFLPAREFPVDKNAIELFCNQWRQKLGVSQNNTFIYKQIRKNILPAGIEFWQPLFFKDPLVPLFSYLPVNTLILVVGNIKDAANTFWNDIQVRFNNSLMDPLRSLLPPHNLWIRVEHLLSELKRWPKIQFTSDTLSNKIGNQNLGYQFLPNIAIDIKDKSPMEKLYKFYTEFNGPVIFAVENNSRLEILSKMLARVKILPILITSLEEANKKGAYFIICIGEKGFIDTLRCKAVIYENDILIDYSNYRKKTNNSIIQSNILVRNIFELDKGQLVVHLKHGIGKYLGLTTIKINGIEGDYLIIAYAGNDKLYVPISSMHLINRYISNINNKNIPLLCKLGSDSWVRIKQKVANQVRDVAVELLEIYAQRLVKRGYSFNFNPESYQYFCEKFPFELTKDQSVTINAVLKDMVKPLAMDRLICGDVGFGKTEVAMRAAFLAVENNKQVAILVPTTLLAQQHFDNFRDRFSNLPVCVEMVSRFRSASDHAKVLKKTIEGKINILIGTHKILQDGIQWKDLGLLIVDEEHRFGVRYKERIKVMRTNIDTLTLTATPIPRTLNMAIRGMRDLSIINTPPACRLAVKTFVQEYDDFTVREAILREISRGGQVYYLFNDVKNIEKIAYHLKILVPEARIVVGHGQLCTRDLERIMIDFYNQLFNVLICTTIIENGIDIANVNTIIIDQADRFGLAQLHQLRGRVGRSYHQAYAYLLTSLFKSLSKSSAHKRLEAIVSLERLGVGFELSMYDLEIRGAGELLGERQSGQMEAIGFSLYMEMLEKAVAFLKEGREPSLLELTNNLMTEIDLSIPAFIPEKYITDINIRLSLYKNIANAANQQELNNIKYEIIDRFGVLPDSAQYLLDITALRHHSQKLGIRCIKCTAKGGVIEFSRDNCIDPICFVKLLRYKSNIYQIDNNLMCLRFNFYIKDYSARICYIKELLKEFQQHSICK